MRRHRCGQGVLSTRIDITRIDSGVRLAAVVGRLLLAVATLAGTLAHAGSPQIFGGWDGEPIRLGNAVRSSSGESAVSLGWGEDQTDDSGVDIRLTRY